MLYNANTITINNGEGYSDETLHSIVDYKFGRNAVKDDDGYVFIRKGERKIRKNTVGVHLKISHRDYDRIYKTWLPLQGMKESHPIEISKFSKSRGTNS